jgi:hypothetical protein
MTTLDTTPQKPAHSECGAGGERQLKIGFRPSSVLLAIAIDTVQLQDEVWEYGFTGDGSLELRFMSADSICGYVRPLGAATMTALTGIAGVLHFSCPRPSSDDHDEPYEFFFTCETSSGTTAQPPARRPLPPQAAGKPEGPTDIEATSAQPTLIIRTKRSCPTGVNKPTWEI